MIIPDVNLLLFAHNTGCRENLQAGSWWAGCLNGDESVGLAPLVVALMVATGWLLSAGNDDARRDWRLWLLAGFTCLVVLRTRWHLLWLLGAGAVLGGLGWV